MKFLILTVLILQSFAAFNAHSAYGDSYSSRSYEREARQRQRERERAARKRESDARMAELKAKLAEQSASIQSRWGSRGRSIRDYSFSGDSTYDRNPAPYYPAPYYPAPYYPAPYYPPPRPQPEEVKNPGRYSPRNSRNITVPSLMEYHLNLLGQFPAIEATYNGWSATPYLLDWMDSIEPVTRRTPGDEFNRYRSQVEFIAAMLKSISATDEVKIASFEAALDRMIKRINVRSKYTEKEFTVRHHSDLNEVEEYVEAALDLKAEDKPYTQLDMENAHREVREEWTRRQNALMEFDFEVGLEIGNPLFTRGRVLRRMEQTGWFRRFETARFEFLKKHALPHDYVFGKMGDDEIGREESALLKQYDFLAEYKKQLDAYLLREGKSHGQYFFFRDVLGIENTETHIELMGLPQEEKLKIINEFQDQLREKLDRLRNIGKEVAAGKDVDFKDATDQRFFELLLTTYFQDIPEADLALVVRDFALRPYQNSSMDLFNRLVLRAGPQFQKLMQVLGRQDGFSEGLRKVFSRVEDAGLPSPYRKIDPPAGYAWEWINPKPFVGSIAQSYHAKIKPQAGNHNVTSHVIAHRVLKTGIKEKISDEAQRLIRVAEVIDRDPVLRQADFPLIAPILDDIKVMATEELDLKKTAENQILGQQVYTSTVVASGLKISFIVPSTFEVKTTSENPEPQSLDSTWLEGHKFEFYHSLHPDRARVVAEQIAKLWVNKAFAAKSFFHSDLHQGNMKVQGKNDGLEIEVGFLDFGMSDSLTAQDKATLIKLGVELSVSRNPIFVADYIWQLSNKDKNLLSQDEFRAKLKAKFAAHRNEGLDYWLRYGLSVGVALKKNINSFSRGLTAITLLLSAGGSPLQVSALLQRAITMDSNSLTKNGLEVLMDHFQASGFFKKAAPSCDESLTGRGRK